MSRALQDSVSEIERGRAQTNDIVAQLRDQQHQVVAEPARPTAVVAGLRFINADKNSMSFHIALFGRTHGREVNSHGDPLKRDWSLDRQGCAADDPGRSVLYHWQGLKVTDVPGVAAFEGAEDEDLAFQAAEMADLVLFLITDDAPAVR